MGRHTGIAAADKFSSHVSRLRASWVPSAEEEAWGAAEGCAQFNTTTQSI